MKKQSAVIFIFTLFLILSGIVFSASDLPNGSPCTTNTQCHFGFCDPSTHKCAAPGSGGNDYSSCTSDSDCTSGLCKISVCLPTNLADGTSCRADGQCTSALCYPGSGRPSTCVPTSKADGASCFISQQCTSGYCNPSTSRCEARSFLLANGASCTSSAQCQSGFCGTDFSGSMVCLDHNLPIDRRCSDNGQCLSNFCNPQTSKCAIIPPCADSDPVDNPRVKGTLSYTGAPPAPFWSGYADYCSSGNHLIEMQCTSDGTSYSYLDIDCANYGGSCSNGACIDRQPPVCTNSDPTNSPYIKGTLTDSGPVPLQFWNGYSDYCTGSTLIEMSCTADQRSYSYNNVDCSQYGGQCSNGICIPATSSVADNQPCIADSQCQSGLCVAVGQPPDFRRR
ncbi:MAG: hypothetical protein HZC29_05975, partial [Thaumarchaeota archaeon]|nr:hypothetical protein [Nitrososphaerota archaeon]